MCWMILIYGQDGGRWMWCGINYILRALTLLRTQHFLEVYSEWTTDSNKQFLQYLRDCVCEIDIIQNSKGVVQLVWDRLDVSLLDLGHFQV
jgi:hypothetical protein